MDKDSFLKKFQFTEVKEFPNAVSGTPKVSVLIQTYQHADFIKNCLDSVLNQKTDFSFEVIVGEDSSTDGTRDICKEYAKKYPEKIRLFLHKNANKIHIHGLKTGNFNVLYNYFHSNGDYLAFCEGDDYWGDDFKLQKQINFLELNKDYISSYHSFVVKEKEINLKDPFYLAQPSTDISAGDLQKLKFHPHISTICYKRVFHELPEQISGVINIDSFIISLLGNYGNMKFIENIKPSLYRRHTGGIWTNETKKIKYQYKALIYNKLEEYYKDVDENELEIYFNTEKRNIYKMQLLFLLKEGEVFKHPKTSMRLFIQILQGLKICTNRK